jgi:MFS family permease
VKHDPYAALRLRDYRYLFAGRFIITLGEQMLDVALGWELYLRTHDAKFLGFVGLALIVPVVLFSLPAGQLVDRTDRRRTLMLAQGFVALCAAGLAVLSFTQGQLPLYYVCIFFLGTGMAFTVPASTALLAQVVPDETFTNAATWNSSSWQLAAVIGPALGGALIAVITVTYPIYALYAVAGLLNVALLARVRPLRPAPPREKASWRSLFAGVRFLGETQVLLGAITLDLFAVLLGGATTLLPIFAVDILHVGARGLGVFRAAPSVGAVCMAFLVAHRPPFERAGRALILAVVGFGVATIIFGLSTWFPLTLAMLVALGALDNISVVIRSTLVLTRTPQAMLGRISAVNSIFVGASNELGGFESGMTAAAFGPVLSVVGGGIGTILVVLGVAALFPELRRLKRLEGEVHEGVQASDIGDGVVAADLPT